ncbi:hypothetical protein KY289_020048 [Solanum tuberosum]|nr:hypothetical protein KY289_020048 [Solanum tuberosum]
MVHVITHSVGVTDLASFLSFQITQLKVSLDSSIVIDSADTASNNPRSCFAWAILLFRLIKVVLPPNLGWGRKRGRGIPTRQAPDPVVEENVIPPPQSQNDTTADTIAIMLQQAMESLVGKIQAQPRESTLLEANKGHNQCNEPLRRSIREFLELKPPVFTGASEVEDPLLFLDGIRKALDTLECSSTRSVKLVAYCLQDIIEEWFKSFKAGRPINSRPLTWKEFSDAFTN